MIVSKGNEGERRIYIEKSEYVWSLKSNWFKEKTDFLFS